ncbi:MAG TPA: hypothetical protein VGI00_02790, partial [Streptosporangiaceae bacterium]
GAAPGDAAPAARPGGGQRSAAAQAAHEAARSAGAQASGRAQKTRNSNGAGAHGAANGTNGHGSAGAEDLDIPDAEDMASPGQAEITGMDLIQRELGGKIIGEIED